MIESDNRSGGHVITATAGSGANKQTFNYATERVVGNGSFGTVFQATCLETAETVRLTRWSTKQLLFSSRQLCFACAQRAVSVVLAVVAAFCKADVCLVNVDRHVCWPCDLLCCVRPCA